MKHIVLTIGLLFLLPDAQAQKAVNIDSLEKATAAMPEDTNKVNNYMELSKAYMRQNYEQTLAYGIKSYRLAKKLNFLRGQISGLNATGIGYMYTRNGLAALPYYDTALTLASRYPDKKLIGKVNGNKGLALDQLGRYQEALACFIEAVKFYEEIKDTLLIASSYANMANSFYRLRKLAEAEQYATRAAGLNKKIGNLRGMSNALNTVATVRFEQKNYAEAEKVYLELIKLRKQLNDIPGLVIINLNMASVYTQTKRFRLAEQCYHEALAYNRIANNSKLRVQLYTNLSTFYKDQGELAKQQLYLDSARVQAEADHDLEDLHFIYRELSKMHEARGDYKTSLKYQRLVQRVGDSLFNAESDARVAEMRTQFETEKKEKEIALLNQEALLKDTVIEKQKSTRNFILAIGGLILVLAAALLVGYRSKRRANILLSEQKTEIMRQKHLVEEKQKEILDSIRYAKRIQQSLLTSEKYIERSMRRMAKK
jgi:tetratricopeptide (TPR) repeat protein